MALASTKLYGNDKLHLPKIVKDEFKEFEIDKNTVFDWDVKDNQIILTPRRKVTLEDVVGMIKDDGKDWQIDKGVYLNE